MLQEHGKKTMGCRPPSPSFGCMIKLQGKCKASVCTSQTSHFSTQLVLQNLFRSPCRFPVIAFCDILNILEPWLCPAALTQLLNLDKFTQG